MLILGIDTASRVCGVALMKDRVLLADYSQNTGKTHSRQLMPMIDIILKQAGVKGEDLDAVAVTSGPGSFTGLRIGVATARALAQGYNIPAVGLSTLEVLAVGLMLEKSLVCPILDARRNEIYTALYRWVPVNSSGELIMETVMEPAAMSLEDLVKYLANYSEPVFFPGDGLYRFQENLLNSLGDRFRKPSSLLTLNRAANTAWLAELKLTSSNAGKYSYHELYPEYLRKPEAERLLICCSDKL